MNCGDGVTTAHIHAWEKFSIPRNIVVKCTICQCLKSGKKSILPSILMTDCLWFCVLLNTLRLPTIPHYSLEKSIVFTRNIMSVYRWRVRWHAGWYIYPRICEQVSVKLCVTSNFSIPFSVECKLPTSNRCLRLKLKAAFHHSKYLTEQYRQNNVNKVSFVRIPGETKNSNAFLKMKMQIWRMVSSEIHQYLMYTILVFFTNLAEIITKSTLSIWSFSIWQLEALSCFPIRPKSRFLFEIQV